MSSDSRSEGEASSISVTEKSSLISAVLRRYRTHVQIKQEAELTDDVLLAVYFLCEDGLSEGK